MRGNFTPTNKPADDASLIVERVRGVRRAARDAEMIESRGYGRLRSRVRDRVGDLKGGGNVETGRTAGSRVFARPLCVAFVH
jgi:hypothetical protein